MTQPGGCETLCLTNDHTGDHRPMLYALAPREIQTGGITETGSFTIKANGKAFKVLIDGLYSNKVRAVIRELCTNAFDSHVMAGNADQPFDLHLPTVFVPEFAVRDYGVSMTHDTVMNLYTTIFESSKEDTNTQVGKLGLGSKSPFAYTDTFTVRAILDGECRTYSAYIGPTHVPQIALLGTEETDEPNGVEVRFPVKAGDTDDFIDEAYNLMFGFDVRPRCTGYVLQQDPVREQLYSGDGWVMYKGRDGGQARQGCVLYPIDYNALSINDDAMYALLKEHLVIDFPIGSLDITASRESLSYDASTRANILAALQKVSAVLAEKMRHTIDDQKTFWDATIAWTKLKAASGLGYQLFKNHAWRGRPLKDNIKLVTEDKNYTPINLQGLEDGRYSIDFYPEAALRKAQRPKPHAYYHSISFAPNMTTVYVHWLDVKTVGAMPRVFEHARANRHNAIVLKVRSKSVLNRILVALGRPKCIDVATLPAIPSARSERNVQPFKGYVNASHDAAQDTFELPSTGGYYVPMVNDDCMSSFEKDAARVQHVALQAALIRVGALATPDVVYRIPKASARKVKDEKWVNLYDLGRHWVKYYADHAAIRSVELQGYLRAEVRSDFGNIRDLANRCQSYAMFKSVVNKETSALLAQVAALATTDPNGEAQRALSDFYPKARRDPADFAAEYAALNQACAEFENRYPLIRHMSVRDGGLADVIHYMNLIDQKKMKRVRRPLRPKS